MIDKKTAEVSSDKICGVRSRVANFIYELKVGRCWLIFAVLSLVTTMYKPIAALALLVLAIEPASAFFAPSQFGA